MFNTGNFVSSLIKAFNLLKVCLDSICGRLFILLGSPFGQNYLH